jgi:hypothetical protein
MMVSESVSVRQRVTISVNAGGFGKS